MTWYAASLIETVVVLDGEQSSFPVYENVILLEAKTPSQARSQAKKIGQQEALGEENLELDGKLAKRVFVGVRKLMTISNPFPMEQDTEPPVSETEITYSEFELATFKDVESLAAGAAIVVNYVK